MAHNHLSPVKRQQFKRYLKFVSLKFRYYSWQRIVLGGLNVLGIHIQPFYVMQEGLAQGFRPPPAPLPGRAQIAYLEKNDMAAIAELPDYPTPLERLRERLDKGQYCLGLRCAGKLAAFTWCDFEACHFHGYRFKLAPTEGYLYDAHTLMEFRGKGLAPWVRFQMYLELEAVGRVKLYSITERFNAPALRFKKKLGARIIDRGTHIGLLNRWHFSSSELRGGRYRQSR